MDNGAGRAPFPLLSMQHSLRQGEGQAAQTEPLRRSSVSHLAPSLLVVPRCSLVVIPSSYPQAARIIQRTAISPGLRKELRWVPAHAGDCSPYAPNHNETAHREARALTHRAPTASARPEGEWWTATKDSPSGYGEILKNMRATRQLFPSPHKSLSREDAVHLRRLQIASVLTPALLHYPDDYPSAQCDICKQGTANCWHILWDCITTQDGVSFTEYPVDLQIAIASTSKSDQEWAIQQVLKALERHGLRKGVPVE